MGDLPSKSEQITSDLSRGIKDVDVAPKKEEEEEEEEQDEIKEVFTKKMEETKQESSEPRKARIRVRFDTDDKEEAKKYLKIRCRQ